MDVPSLEVFMDSVDGDDGNLDLVGGNPAQQMDLDDL